MAVRGPRPKGRPYPWGGAVLVVLATLALSGCARAPQATYPDFRGRPQMAANVIVEVRNQNYSDIVLRVSTGGSWQRLGDVTGNSSGRLEISGAMLSPAGDYRFRVHAIGSSDNSDYISDRISASRGRTIVLVVAPVLRMSSWSLRD
jgi:hypothetical protein